MHELSLVCQMVEEVEAIAFQEQAKEIISLTILLGALSGVDRDALEFAYPAAVQGTQMENTVLIIEEIPTTLQCGDCGEVSYPDIPMIECGICGSNNVEIVAGKDLLIKSIELNT